MIIARYKTDKEDGFMILMKNESGLKEGKLSD